MEKIARFWSWWSTAMPDESFFSLNYGEQIVRIVERHVTLRNRLVADVGTGPGHLLDRLLDRGARCVGVELSPVAAEVANRRLADRPGFDGVRVGSVESLPLADASVDVAFCVELVEHLLDEQLKRQCAELARVIRPGGHLIVTTPNEEDLADLRAVCPDCGAVFHSVQHMRSWTSDTLLGSLRPHGFEAVSTIRTVLAPTRAQTLASRAKLTLHGLLRSGRAKPPQLILVARRT